jgi:hypothetical protein
MPYIYIVIFSFSIVIPAIIGWVRFKKINPTYYPFIICLWIGLINEIVSYVVSQYKISNALNSNVYVLAESLLINWQFRRWGIFERMKSLFALIMILFIGTWVVENFIISKITYFSSYFRIIYSFAISLMSISLINSLIVREKKQFLRNSMFLISIGFILYYTYKVLVEAFWIYGLNNSREFRNNVYLILAYINLIANFIYALAILWMPTKHRFSLPF